MNEIIQLEYTLSIKVASFDTDRTDRMRLSSVLRYQQEAGERHLSPAGLGWRDLSGHGIAFVASRWHTVIRRLPQLDEEVTLTTWHRNRKGPRFFRCYEWRDADGNLLIEGVMQFALVSVTDHRLLRGDEFMALAPLLDATRGVSCADPGRFRLTEEEDNGTYTVRWSDIDRNGHMNNTCYADLAWDALPSDRQDETPTDMELHFAGESRQGDVISLSTSTEAERILCVAGDTDRGRVFSAKITFGE
ncbi:MAG: hypothetical protein IJN04_06820 [Clostridia bacterium]|nr:hypothetical protein [Clostridia bacterium]